MEFKFTIQEYQTKAADAVVQVFEGQPKVEGQQFVRDLGVGYYTKTGQAFMVGAGFDDAVESSDGYRNAPLALSGGALLNNVQAVQRANAIRPSEKLSHALGAVELDVEMETGTGKTYVYTETIFELNRRYGWSKFIIVVPNVATREGVGKSFQTTERHFFERYGKKLWWFIYNSDRLNELDTFTSRSDISVMIINMQNFNKSFKKGGTTKEALRMFSERDDFGSRRPIDVLAATNPILILDEPQKMGKKGSATRRAMQQFRPLFSLNYSATHTEHHNEVYALDALDAYNMRLVKRIEVKGFEVRGMRGTDGYLCLQEIKVFKDKPPVAVIEFTQRLKSGAMKRQTRRFNEGDDIYVASGELEAYRNDLVIAEIVPDQPGVLGHVRFRNGEELRCGEVVGDSTGRDLRRVQIRETIKSHLQKEERLYERGIKCLSLFFIDEVAKYRLYDEEGNQQLGEYGRIFEEEYDGAVRERLAHPQMGDEFPGSYVAYLSRFRPDMVHKGYFSIDKKGRAVDSKTRRGSEDSDDESAYDLILRDKERLLSFDEPMRFIFSHSALREGWDNPNVFQICTLKESGSETSKRQEVGRGMRLCVDQHGDRQDAAALGESMVQRLNLLTVIASESYASFVEGLQKDMSAELRERPQKVEASLFEGVTVSNDAGATTVLAKEDAQEIMFALSANRLIDKDGLPTERFIDEGIQAISPDDLSEHLYDFLPDIEKLVRSTYDSHALDSMIENGLEAKAVTNPLNANFGKREFQELWGRINVKHAYTVHFDDEELRSKAIAYIDRDLSVSRVTYRMVTGAQRSNANVDELTAGDHFELARTETHDLAVEDGVQVRYDLVGEVARRAGITRRSAAAILAGMSAVKFRLFQDNPEEFISKVGDAIVDEKAAMVVEHISYNKLDERYDSEIFTEDMPESLARAYHAKKSVQDYVFPDGTAAESVERRFAEDLDAADEVVVYAKLPRSFKIPTPVGGYAPDWAIVFKRDAVKHVFFVAETKGSMSSLQLRGVERAKIACARKLFNEASDADVRYDVVDSYEELLKLVRS